MFERKRVKPCVRKGENKDENEPVVGRGRGRGHVVERERVRTCVREGEREKTVVKRMTVRVRVCGREREDKGEGMRSRG